ncbi:MAG: ABC transporter ATP-binding protein [Candidatus Lokiarchaeota archaeon]|nr:ABC transporter ATP-binding protein [Candidatus Lokiarchaeota archaeon]
MKYVLKAEDLKKDYQQGSVLVHVLRGVNLNVEEGEFISILGPSGSGKSTLLNLFGVLDIPTQGKIIINGTNISKLSNNKRAELRREIGFVFQFFNLIPRLSIYKNIELALNIKNISKKEREKKILPIIQEVGLEDRINHRPNELSGGQKQRVAIARALAQAITYLPKQKTQFELCRQWAKDLKNQEVLIKYKDIIPVSSYTS